MQCVVVLMAGIYCSESRQRAKAEDMHMGASPTLGPVPPSHAGHALSPESDYRTLAEHRLPPPQEAVGTSIQSFYGELVTHTHPLPSSSRLAGSPEQSRCLAQMVLFVLMV